jgi:hypothetical protein
LERILQRGNQMRQLLALHRSILLLANVRSGSRDASAREASAREARQKLSAALQLEILRRAESEASRPRRVKLVKTEWRKMEWRKRRGLLAIACLLFLGIVIEHATQRTGVCTACKTPEKMQIQGNYFISRWRQYRKNRQATHLTSAWSTPASKWSIT